MSAATVRAIRAAVARAQREISEDIAAGIVPATVGTFSDLHDYVDANTYGGLCDEDCPPELGVAHLENVNAYQDAVDAWLRAGRVDA